MLRWRKHQEIEFENLVFKKMGRASGTKSPREPIGIGFSKQNEGRLHLSLNKEGRSMGIYGCMKIAKLDGRGLKKLLAKKLLVPQ